MRNKWIKKEGSALVPAVSEVDDVTRLHLQHVQKQRALPDPKLLADYKKRKLVVPTKDIDYSIIKGPKFQLEMPVEVTDLTAEMLADGSWETANFKPYVSIVKEYNDRLTLDEGTIFRRWVVSKVQGHSIRSCKCVLN